MSERTFGGIPQENAQYDSSKVVLVPIPYDGTSTYGKGADKGPTAFLDAAENMELFDIETQSEVYKEGIYLAPAMDDEYISPEAMVEDVTKTIKQHIEEGKFVTAFGGEHSISIGTIRAHQQHYEEISVLQIDAHSDLRPEYQGSACNHACAVHEASKTTNLIQVGIRSMDTVELPFVKRGHIFYAHEIYGHTDWIEEVVDKLTPKVYITIDLDAFDSSIMPSTGTPEPGGMDYWQVLNLIKKVNEHHDIIGFDIVELAPNEHNQAPDFLAAKLYYQMLSYIFAKRNSK